MAFSPRLNSNGMANNPWWYSSGNIYYASGYGLPNCTCYAYGRYAEIHGEFAALPSGDGGQWYDAAIGFNRGSTPKLGAIACYKSRSGQYAGHVAVVEVINDDGSIITSNSAYNGTYFFTNTVYASDGYVAGWMTTNRDYYCQGFIYNDAGGTGISTNASVIAAICGCWTGESICNPGVWESQYKPLLQDGVTINWSYMYNNNTGGFGLGQWTNTGSGDGMRLLRLHNWCVDNNLHGDSQDIQDGYLHKENHGEVQLEYFIYENLWFNKSHSQGVIGNYSTLTEFLETDITDIPTLVNDFMLNWEGWDGHVDAHIPVRIEAAEIALEYIQEHYLDNPNDYEWVTLNGYLPRTQWLNNVMCIYFWLGSGAEPVKKKRTIINNPVFVANMRRKILIHRRF